MNIKRESESENKEKTNLIKYSLV